MKNFFKGLLSLTVCLIIFPAVPWLIGTASVGEESLPASSELNIPKSPSDSSPFSDEGVLYLDAVTGKITEIPVLDYVAGAVACQLSPECPEELLKAQSVIMYTYILKRRLDLSSQSDSSLSGCDVSSDVNKYPRIVFDGEGVDLEIYKKIAAEVEGEFISYAGEPITVAFCRSAGKSTESALTVLGIDVPYLKETPSEEPDNYPVTVTYTSEEVFARLTTTEDEYILLGEPSGWIEITQAKENGYVSEVALDSSYKLSGEEFALILNLPSARFTYRYSPGTDRFTFTSSGCGSLVGLSQRGAAVMAARGESYRDILKHFFSGVEIEGGNEDIG